MRDGRPRDTHSFANEEAPLLVLVVALV
jgi:hypothetical protein